MKWIWSIWIMSMIGVLFGSMAHAQTGIFTATEIKPVIIDIGYYQTANLIFPYAIKSVDKGSSAVLAQKAKGVENILQVKAARKDFESTNISLVTADGGFYSFVLRYASDPLQLNWRFGTSEGNTTTAHLEGSINVRELEDEAAIVLRTPDFLRKVKKEQQLKITLAGIYVSDTFMWWKLRISNTSLIDFRPDYIHFLIKEKKKTKRTAVQETEISPLYSTNLEKVGGHQDQEWVIGFNPFTIASNKKMVIEVGETANGRSILLPVKSKMILRAKRLP